MLFGGENNLGFQIHLALVRAHEEEEEEEEEEEGMVASTPGKNRTRSHKHQNCSRLSFVTG